MRQMRVAIACSCLLLGANVANAADVLRMFINGNKLLEWCEAPKGRWQFEACEAYVEAISDALEVNRVDMCVPVSVDSGQVRDVVIKYLRENPVIRHDSAARLATLAIIAAWCPK